MNYLREIQLPELPEDSYVEDIPAVRFLHESGRMRFEAPVTFLVGENGTGKSTLLEAIAVSSLRIKKQGEVKNFCRSHPAGPRRIGLAQSSGKSTLPTKE